MLIWFIYITSINILHLPTTSLYATPHVKRCLPWCNVTSRVNERQEDKRRCQHQMVRHPLNLGQWSPLVLITRPGVSVSPCRAASCDCSASAAGTSAGGRSPESPRPETVHLVYTENIYYLQMFRIWIFICSFCYVRSIVACIYSLHHSSPSPPSICPVTR